MRLRTERAPRSAPRARLRGVSAGLKQWRKGSQIDSDGSVEGPPVDAARAALDGFYKHDEAYAFSLWASPRTAPQYMVLYFEARPHRRPIWVALRADGSEIRDGNELPRGAFRAMRQAEGDDAALWSWPQEILEDDDLFGGPARPRPRRVPRPPRPEPARAPPDAGPR